MPLVGSGMTMVFPEMFMTPLWAGRRGGCRDRLSGDRRSLGRGGSPPGPAHTGNMDRPALADFLRHRREALRPADVGLPAGELWVPRTSSTSRDQAVFADHATDASLPPDALLIKIDRFG